MLEMMTGITQDDLENKIRPVYQLQGADAAKRELKRVSGQPLVETQMIVKNYFEDLK